MAIKKIVLALLTISTLIIGVIIIITALTTSKAPQEFQYKQHNYIYFPGKGIIHSPACHECAITFERI